MVKSFVLGLGVGTTVGLMYAPKRGSETRAGVAGRFREAIKAVKDNWQAGNGDGNSKPDPGKPEPKSNESSSGDSRQSSPESTSSKTSFFQPRPTSKQSTKTSAIGQTGSPANAAVTNVLNTAKKDELMEVNGIGNATAKRIIKHRPYDNAEKVLEERVLPEETFEKLKEQLVQKKKPFSEVA
jgi:competence protein ComEA